MKLVIVESPNKCNTIGNYLGEDYLVVASKGHVRDLATSGPGGLGVNTAKDFTPTYIINKDKQSVVKMLRQEEKKATEVILATDPDREGEAIAWHLCQVLGLDPSKTKRLEFHEITRDSIEKAIQNPRKIDMNLVASQETRRIFDRIIGFKLSALLKSKIKSRSAGRVQSATLKLICDHQKEINSFVPEKYWTITIELDDGLTVSLDKIDGKAAKINSEDIDKEVLNRLHGNVTVSSITTRTRKVESKPAFSTSTMQQEAFNVYGFSTKKSQAIAQKLYEGIEVGSEHVGLITYIRTDATNLSQEFINKSFSYIEKNYGKEYLGQVKIAKKSALKQYAHEAIRQTSNFRTPDSLKEYLTASEFKLYKLIYNRALASLASPKIENVTTVIFEINGLTFKIESVQTAFNGYEIIYGKANDETAPLPNIINGQQLAISKINNKEELTKAPQPYSEAKIVKMMEDLGIGRPSTYATTISILNSRDYITDKHGIVIPTEQGMLTAHILEKYFPELVDTKYTANMEESLDTIQDGSETRTKLLSDFYFPFDKKVKEAYKIIYNEPEKPTGGICPICGSPLVYKKGKYGQFVACSAFPKCNYVEKPQKKEPVLTGELCPKCGKPLVERESRGKKFIACSGYPQCRYIKKEESQNKEIVYEPTGKKCPKCGGDLLLKKGRYGDFYGCSNYPKCHYQEKIKKESD